MAEIRWVFISRGVLSQVLASPPPFPRLWLRPCSFTYAIKLSPPRFFFWGGEYSRKTADRDEIYDTLVLINCTPTLTILKPWPRWPVTCDICLKVMSSANGVPWHIDAYNSRASWYSMFNSMLTGVSYNVTSMVSNEVTTTQRSTEFTDLWSPWVTFYFQSFLRYFHALSSNFTFILHKYGFKWGHELLQVKRGHWPQMTYVDLWPLTRNKGQLRPGMYQNAFYCHKTSWSLEQGSNLIIGHSMGNKGIQWFRVIDLTSEVTKWPRTQK